MVERGKGKRRGGMFKYGSSWGSGQKKGIKHTREGEKVYVIAGVKGKADCGKKRESYTIMKHQRTLP